MFDIQSLLAWQEGSSALALEAAAQRRVSQGWPSAAGKILPCGIGLSGPCLIEVNKPILNMLKLVQPYVTYGFPSLKTVRELIYKRGYGKAADLACVASSDPAM